MSQQFLVIIRPLTEEVKLAQCFSYEYDEYNYMKDSNGKPIFFNTEEDGIKWINENIQSKYNYYYKDSINKYLKSSNETVEVPVELIKYAINNIFILEAISGSYEFDYNYVDGITPQQIQNLNNKIKCNRADSNYYKLCDLVGASYTRE